MTIEIRNETTAVVDEREFVELSRFVFEAMHLHPATEMSIIFVDEEAMEKLHVQWLDLPGPTDVMSFPMDELRAPDPDDEPPLGLLGDIVLCPQVTSRQAAENGRRPEEEAEYLLIHGLLHLLGHDHAEPGEKAVMFGLNDKLIAAWQRRKLGA